MSINAPTQAGDKPVCAEPENLMLVDHAHRAKGRFAHKVRERMFEELCARRPYTHNLREIHVGGAEFTQARAKRYDSAAVRAWAREVGLEVPAKGIPKREVFDAYDAAMANGQAGAA